MAALSDHDRRDAEHAARMEFALIVGKYVRRMNDISKAYIKEDLDDAAKNGRSVDGTSVGRAAAERAAKSYFGGLAGANPQDAIEGNAVTA